MLYFYGRTIKKGLKTHLLFTLCFLGFAFSLTAQQYKVNGDATKDGCSCYTLTPDQLNMSGSVWNKHKISLADTFDFTFSVFLGYNDPGADGLAFVLQPISTGVGSTGGGMGYQGITPAVGVTIDTYENAGDPTYDHIAVQLNGNTDHTSSDNIAGPVQALPNSANIEDGKWHSLRVTWDPVTQTLKVYMEGVLRLQVSKDFTNDVFSGDPMVYWGLTASTGGAKNLQRFCTQSVAKMNVDTSQAFCGPTSVSFEDSSRVFGDALNWYWSFGDGDSSYVQNPSHVYSTPGNYTASLYVDGGDGCSSDTVYIPINIYTVPTADFTVDTVCLGEKSIFTNTSSVNTSNNNFLQDYFWNLGNGTTSTQKKDTLIYANPGTYSVYLKVTTNNGCSHDTTKQVVVYPLPQPDFDAGSVCLDSTTQFTDQSLLSNSYPSDSIINWEWDFGDNSDTTGIANPMHHYNSADTFLVTLTVEDSLGCSNSIQKQVIVFPLPNPKISPVGELCDKESVVHLTAQPSGGTFSGNGVSGEKFDPGNVGEGNYKVIYDYTNSYGCSSSDTINIIVHPSPVASFTPTNATKHKSETIHFENTSTGATDYFWTFSPNMGSTSDKNPDNFFNQNKEKGSYNITLIVKNNFNCSDTAYGKIKILPSIIKYQFPNIFTPNGDNQNDNFELVKHKNIKAFHIFILNRWGNLLFESEKVDFQWNGKAKNSGANCDDGVYFYKATLTNYANKDVKVTGFVHLVREK